RYVGVFGSEATRLTLPTFSAVSPIPGCFECSCAASAPRLTRLSKSSIVPQSGRAMPKSLLHGLNNWNRWRLVMAEWLLAREMFELIRAKVPLDSDPAPLAFGDLSIQGNNSGPCAAECAAAFYLAWATCSGSPRNSIPYLPA